MLISKKPTDDTKLKFSPMGAKKVVVIGKKPTADVENAADAKKPGDKAEDNADKKKPKTKGKSSSFFAKKAAAALAVEK